jgi:hypothetical protein
MYEISTHAQEESTQILQDDYIPLTVEIGDQSRPLNYLRYISDYSLLELGISAENGVLCLIKLVQVNGVSIDKKINFALPVVAGLPKFDQSKWKKTKIIDINHQIRLFVDRNAILITLDDSKTPEKIIKNKNLSFATSAGTLCWMTVSQLTDEQVLHVQRMAERSTNQGFL